MKIVLSAIGGFFVKIWRWIKETAWIQPLLIVGIIFGLIFSIQPISKGIKDLSESMTNSEKYYKDNKITLYNKKAENFLFGKSGDELNLYAKDDKYFLVFVGKECPHCKEQYDGFKMFLSMEPYKSKNYKVKTIYVDEEMTFEDGAKKKEGIFYDIWFSTEGDNFREAIYNAGQGFYGATYLSEKQSKVSDWDEKLQEILDGSDLHTPLVLLMDKDALEKYPSSYGISQVMLGVTADNAKKRADMLEDCWWGRGDFEKRD